jgi:hypothetical protein
VERRRIELEITELTIDEAKEQYLARLEKQVTLDDILEVLSNEPHFFALEERGRTRYNLLGPNNAGRFLLTAVARLEGTRWRVVTAHWMDARRGKRDYDGGLGQ